MATITEDYVSFETAKLLKEKGFNAECRAAYTNYGKLFTTQIQQYITNILCSKGILWDCIAPTLQMAMRWLREAHNIDVSVVPLRSSKEYLPRVESDIISYDGIPCKKYEEACEAAINYCLENLI